mgnify:CR=1 FL=1
MKWQPEIGSNDEGIICVWPSFYYGDQTREQMLEWFKDTFGFDITIIGIVETLPNPEDRDSAEPATGGRPDFFFRVPNEEIGKFAIARFQFGIRWWEDIFFNKGQDIYPREFIKAYPCPVKEWA